MAPPESILYTASMLPAPAVRRLREQEGRRRTACRAQENVSGGAGSDICTEGWRPASRKEVCGNFSPPGRRVSPCREGMKWTEQLKLSPEERADGLLRGPRVFPYPYLEIPDGIRTIGPEVFKGNAHIRVVSLPGTIKEIGRQAFAGCSNLEAVQGEEQLEGIGEEAFSGCVRLTKAVLPGHLRRIGTRAFAGCSITEAKIPQSVTELGDQPFYHCVNLRTYCVPPNLQDGTPVERQLGIPDAAGFMISAGRLEMFRNVHGRRRVSVPDEVTVVGAGAFDESQVPAKGLEICLPPGVRTIERSAAFLSGKVRISLPDGYLAQARQLPAQATVELLEHPWKNEYLARDIASLYLFQSGVLLNKAAALLEERDPEQMVRLMLRRLEEPLSPARSRRGLARVAEFCFAHAAMLPAGWHRKYFPAGTRPADLVLEANSVDPANALFSQVLRRGGAEPADPDTVKLPLAAYLAVGLHCERLGVHPFLVPMAEEAAGELDETSFQAILSAFFAPDGSRPASLYPFFRFVPGSQAKPYLPGTKPRSGKRRGHPDMQAATKLRPAFLSDTDETMLEMVRTEGAHPEERVLRTYLEVLAPLERHRRLCFPSPLGLDADGGKTYFCGGSPVLEIFFEKDGFRMRDPRTKRRRKTVPSLPGEAARRIEVTQDMSAIQDYYASVVDWVQSGQVDSFLTGEGLDPAVWQQIYQDPCLEWLGSGVLWEQDGRLFVWDGAHARNHTGRRIRLKTDVPVRAAHPLEMTDAEKNAWMRWFARKPAQDRFDQLREPSYTLQELAADRYAGCHIESWDLQKAEPQLGFEQSLRRRHNALAIGAHGSLEAAAPASTRGSARLMLGELTIAELDRCANHAIYLLDCWTAEQRVARDDPSILKALETFPRGELGHYLDIAVRHGAAQLTAALLECTDTASPAAEEEFTLD